METGITLFLEDNFQRGWEVIFILKLLGTDQSEFFFLGLNVLFDILAQRIKWNFLCTL